MKWSVILILSVVFSQASHAIDKSEKYANLILQEVDRQSLEDGLIPTKKVLIQPEGDPRYIKNCLSSRAFSGNLQFGFTPVLTRLYNAAYSKVANANKHTCYLDVSDPNQFGQCHVDIDGTDTFGRNYDAVHSIFVSKQDFEGNFYIQICIERYQPDF